MSFVDIESWVIWKSDGKLIFHPNYNILCLKNRTSKFGQMRDFANLAQWEFGPPKTNPQAHPLSHHPTTSRVDAFSWARENDVIGSHLKMLRSWKGFLIKVSLLEKCKTEITSLLRIIINYNPILPRLYNIVIIFIKILTVHLGSLDFLTDCT